MFNDINEAVEFVCQRFNNNSSFEAFKAYMQKKGNPQNQLKVIHVAGTNGKGSTVQFLTNILMCANYKVGSFVSPHLYHHQDRIKINHQDIDDQSFIKYLNEIYDDISLYNLNMFQIDYVIMCKYFIEHGVDIAVIETGLGGRLDATNVIDNPLCSVITTIDLDHQERLGDTIGQIAFEKAGIIKRNRPTIIGYLDAMATDVIENVCKLRHSLLVKVHPYQKINHHRFAYQQNIYHIQSMANYQMANAALAIEVITTLSKLQLIAINNQQIIKGLDGEIWKGRFENIYRNIYIDGAHNIQGIKALVDSFENLPRPIITVASILKDKQALEMLEILNQHSDKLYVTTFDFYRAMSPIELKQVPIGIIDGDWHKLLMELLKNDQGSIVICGSLYFISEIRDFIDKYSKMI